MVNSFVLVAAAAGASLVAAQNLTGSPDCAIDCLTPAIASVCTPADDTACACANTSDIGLAAVDCLLAACDSAELTQAQSAGAAVCADFSATASPSAAASTTAAAAPVTTGSGSASNATITTSSSSSSSGTTTRATATATGTSSSASASATGESSAAAAGALNPVVGFAVAMVAGVFALL